MTKYPMGIWRYQPHGQLSKEIINAFKSYGVGLSMTYLYTKKIYLQKKKNVALGKFSVVPKVGVGISLN
jgi:hypothetical protein